MTPMVAAKVARSPPGAGRDPPSVAVRPRLSYDALAPGPPARPRPRAAAPVAPSAPRGTRARHPPLPRPPLRRRDGGGPRPGRGAALRRDRRELHRALLARHPRNAVRLDLPQAEPREEPDERYRRAAKTLAAWRSDGTLRKDPRPSVYVYEQTYRVPGTGIERTQRGFFARLRIEPFGPGSSVLPHERTLSGPKEDRYRLLRATGINTSPVVGLYEDPSGGVAADAGSASRPSPRSRTSPTTTASATACGSSPTRARAPRPPRRSSPRPPAGPVYIADGHHRYETAVRYRDERRTASTRAGPGLRLPADAVPRCGRPAHGAADAPRRPRPRARTASRASVTGCRALFTVDRPTRPRPWSRATRPPASSPGGAGRFGLVTRDGALAADGTPRGVRRARGRGGDAVRALDVSLLGGDPGPLLGIDAAAVAGGERITYTQVRGGGRCPRRRAHAAGPTPRSSWSRRPVASILAVAATAT